MEMPWTIGKQICLNCINNTAIFNDVGLSVFFRHDVESGEYYFDDNSEEQIRTIAELRDHCCVTLGINLNDKDNYGIAYDVTMWNSRRIGNMDASVSEYASKFMRATQIRFLCSHFLAMTTMQEDD